MLGVLACFACLCTHMLGVLPRLVCLRASMLVMMKYFIFWHASGLCVLMCVHSCYDEIFYFLTCLRTWCIGTWCAFLSYLLYISTLKFKNSCSEKFACFVKLNIFLIYILIPTYKTIWNQFKGSRKVNRYIIYDISPKQYHFLQFI